MKCLACSTQTMVLETRRGVHDDPPHLVRLRKCPACSERFKSIEVPMETWNTVAEDARLMSEVRSVIGSEPNQHGEDV